MPKRSKLWIVLAVLLVVSLGGGVQALRWWWYHGYSRGTRTGLLRKLSVKGSPLCRYVSGELALAGQAAGREPEVWEFTLDDTNPNNPVLLRLREAERKAKQVTLEYRQDLENRGKLWVCAPTDYYVTGVVE